MNKHHAYATKEISDGSGPDRDPDIGFATLSHVLREAYEQAAYGKGNERHGAGKAFADQPILEIARMLNGIDGHAFQVMKKAQEAARMVRSEQRDAAVRELLGVIVYAAAAVLLIREH